MSYLWDRKETHENKTLDLINLNSQHDQEAIEASDEMDFVIFTNRGDCLTMETTHYVVLVFHVEA